jgi:hypothetical protein
MSTPYPGPDDASTVTITDPTENARPRETVADAWLTLAVAAVLISLAAVAAVALGIVAANALLA